MGELWGPVPGARPAPVEPPFGLDLGGECYQFTETRPLVIAAAFACGDVTAMIPGMLDEADAQRVAARLDDDDDPLMDADLELCAWVVGTRMCAIGEGVIGWRRSWWICQLMLTGWDDIAGLFLQHGLNPASAPLWQLCALIWRIAVVEGDPDERREREAKLSKRLPFEQAARRSGRSRGDAPFDRKQMTQAFMARMGAKGALPGGRSTDTRVPKASGGGRGGGKSSGRAARVAAARAKALGK